MTKSSLMIRIGKAIVCRKEKRPGRKELQLTDKTKQEVKHIVHDFFMEKRIPTLDMILQAANE